MLNLADQPLYLIVSHRHSLSCHDKWGSGYMILATYRVAIAIAELAVLNNNFVKGKAEVR